MKRDASFFLPTKTRLRFSRVEREIDPSFGLGQHASLADQPPKFRSIAIMSLCFLGLALLFSRVAALQTIQASSFQQKSNKNRIRVIYHDAPRGAIIDSRGIVLTENAPDIGIYITREDIPTDASELQNVFEKISLLTGKPIGEITDAYQSLLDDNRSPIEPSLLIPNITQEQAIAVAINAEHLPGIRTAPRIIRHYPKGEAFSHLLGYVGKMDEQTWKKMREQPDYLIDDAVGKSGLEQTYESSIKGTHAKETVEVDALGHVMRTVSSEVAKTGQTLSLTLDAELQQVIFDSLQHEVSKLNSTGGSAVAIDPRNGGVLALVSTPSFNNNFFAEQNSEEILKIVQDSVNKPLFNRAISGEYPSGSTIKPVIAAAALEEGVITEQSSVLSTGGIRIDQWFFPDWKSGGHGQTNVIKAIAESVNTFFYSVGGGTETINGLGVDRIREYAERFGLNSVTNLDLPNEASGFLPTKEWKEKTKNEPWYIGDTYHLSIGQGDLLVTPLQVALFTSAIANGGTVYQPHIKKLSENEDPVIKNPQVVSKKTIDIVSRGMRETVLSGSARSFQSLTIPVAAKTGTAQFGTSNKTHAWFTCFAPYTNATIALVIMIEGGGEGSSNAAPVAKTIIDWWAKNRQ